MNKDNIRLTREEIVSKPGYLAAKIVHNIMIENKFNLCFIGNTMGNTLYTVQLNNKQRAIVCFTDDGLLESYVNRKKVRQTINDTFGNQIVSVTMNICTLNAILEDYNNEDERETVKIIIVNPNTRDYFIPVNISLFSKIISKSGLIEEEDINNTVYEENVKKMEYDKEEKKFFFSNEIN